MIKDSWNILFCLLRSGKFKKLLTKAKVIKT
jgi:hypothetical protein